MYEALSFFCLLPSSEVSLCKLLETSGRWAFFIQHKSKACFHLRLSSCSAHSRPLYRTDCKTGQHTPVTSHSDGMNDCSPRRCSWNMYRRHLKALLLFCYGLLRCPVTGSHLVCRFSQFYGTLELEGAVTGINNRH